MTVIGAESDKSVCLQFLSLAAMNQLIYCNQSAQPQQSGSSAALDQVSYQIQSAQLQYISSLAAISQLVCSGARNIDFGSSVSAELQCVSSSAIHLLERLDKIVSLLLRTLSDLFL